MERHSNQQLDKYKPKKMIQAKFSTYGRLYFLEFELNLLQIHLILDYTKTE